jgi:hypothetical protein
VRIPLEGLLAVLAGERESTPARMLKIDGDGEAAIDVAKNDFIPTVDRYQLRVAVAARDLLRGERLVVV